MPGADAVILDVQPLYHGGDYEGYRYHFFDNATEDLETADAIMQKAYDLGIPASMTSEVMPSKEPDWNGATINLRDRDDLNRLFVAARERQKQALVGVI